MSNGKCCSDATQMLADIVDLKTTGVTAIILGDLRWRFLLGDDVPDGCLYITDGDGLSVAAQPVQAESCHWSKANAADEDEPFETACGKEHMLFFDAEDGDFPFRYCPYCGKSIHRGPLVERGETTESETP